MKKLLSALLATVMLLTFIPLGAISVAAATAGTTGECTWTLNGTHLTISGNGAMENCTYSAPAPWGTAITSVTIEHGVTSIGDYAFKKCSSLQSVTIPDSVTSIGNSAFFGCSALKEVHITDIAAWCGINFGDNPLYYAHNLYVNGVLMTDLLIPDNVTSIGDDAFYGCTSLESVTIGDNVTSIGNSAFYYCTSLESVTIPDSVTSIGSWTFRACSSLEKVTIGDNVTSIGNYAFNDCSSLTSVTIPDSVTSIGDSAFRGCTSLTSVTIPDSVTSIWDYAFRDCTSLMSVTIGNSVTSIGWSAFSGCSSLETVTIPDSVILIGSSAFSGCSSLEMVTIPDSVISIGNYAFNGCSKNLIIYGKPGSSAETYAKNNNITFVPPSGTTGDCTWTLEGTHLTISGNGAMENAPAPWGTAITSVTIEHGVTSIGNYAFRGCTSLTSVTIPDSVTSIGDYAFRGCTSLTSVTIGNSVTSIGDYVFEGCSSLTSVTIPDYSIKTMSAISFGGCSALEEIILPKGLTTISAHALSYNPSLTKVVIPESVTSIASDAFLNSPNVTIYGKPGSYAETFANDNGFAFVNNYVAAEGFALVDGVEYIVLDRGETYRAQFEVYPINANDVITLTASNWNVTISGMNIYARYVGDTVVTATTSGGLTYEFTVHVRTVQSISVVTLPNKMQYELGETVDLTGMVVQAKYSDGTTQAVIDYTVSGFDSSAEGECSVKIQWTAPYGSTYFTTFTVMIGNPLTGIYVATLPDRVYYERKESLDLTGLVIMATYTDGSKQAVTDYTVSGYNALKNGKQTITVTFEGFTDTFVVEVVHVHTYDGDCDPNCNGCGLTREAAPHTYTGDCDVYCDGCGLERNAPSDHIYDSACDDSCNVCGVLREVSGHLYDNEYDATCNECGAVREVPNEPQEPESIPGDANGDGKVNNRDLGMLQQYLNGWDVTIDIGAMDVNNDNKVNNRDLGMLQQYLNGWDVELS